MKAKLMIAPLFAGLALIAAPAMAKPVVPAPAPAQVSAPASVAVGTAIYAPITAAEVEEAQRGWCSALVAISIEADTKGQPAAKAMAEQVIDGNYAYDMGPVLFKPTQTVAPQTFRTTREGALSYFVGGNTAYPADGGFALKHWRKCQSENVGIVITGNSAISMGNVSFWDDKGNMTKVDKTWGYVRGAGGKLRIVLHHSSLPYTPK